MSIEQLIQEQFGSSAQIIATEEMEKGASSRRYFRLALKGASAPATLVHMALPDDALQADEVVSGDMPDELPFLNVQRYLDKAGLPVPQIYVEAIDEQAVLLEDLGETTLNKQLRGKNDAQHRAWYLAAVELLSRMHNHMFPVPSGCQAATQFFDYKLLRWELSHYREWGIEANYQRHLSAGDGAAFDAAMDDLARQIDRLEKGFVHRDYQSRNLMVRGDAPSKDNLSIIDFQDALTGPRIYDLVALLNDSYVELSPQLKDELIAQYAHLRHLNVDTTRYEFNLVTVHRKLKDGGRFVFIDQVKGDPSFLPFVDTSFKRAQQSLQKLDGLTALKKILAKVHPEYFSRES